MKQNYHLCEGLIPKFEAAALLSSWDIDTKPLKISKEEQRYFYVSQLGSKAFKMQWGIRGFKF